MSIPPSGSPTDSNGLPAPWMGAADGRITIALCLPRTPTSVSVARSILDHVFAIVGVRPDCRDELALAVTEACGKAVRHADGVSTYALTAESNERECTVTVADDGPGIAENLSTMPPPSAIGGRGFALMRSRPTPSNSTADPRVGLRCYSTSGSVGMTTRSDRSGRDSCPVPTVDARPGLEPPGLPRRRDQPSWGRNGVVLVARLVFLAVRFSLSVRPGFLAEFFRGDLSDMRAPHSDLRS